MADDETPNNDEADAILAELDDTGYGAPFDITVDLADLLDRFNNNEARTLLFLANLKDILNG
jgi:hypothetical protein